MHCQCYERKEQNDIENMTAECCADQLATAVFNEIPVMTAECFVDQPATTVFNEIPVTTKTPWQGKITGILV